MPQRRNLGSIHPDRVKKAVNLMLLLPISALLMLLAVSAYAFYKGWRQPVIRILLLTLFFLAVEQFLLCRRMVMVIPSQAMMVQQLMQAVQVLSLVAGMAFSYGYGQVYGWSRIKEKAWIFLGALAGGLLTVFLPYGELMSELPFLSSDGWIFALGLRGQLFHIIILLGATLILVNLEKLLRSSYGQIRWQLKFSTIGIGTFFALKIYQSGYALVFNSWREELDGIASVGLILACFCLVIALRRTTEGLDIYISTNVLQKSVAALVVGAYLVGVGLLVTLFRYFGLHGLVEQAFLIVAGVFLVLLFFSDRSRQSLRLFTHRHFRRPAYDYRILWNRFNTRVSTEFDENSIARDVVRMISETLELVFVAIWTYDQQRRLFQLAASSSGAGESFRELASADMDKFLAKSYGLLEIEDLEADFPVLEELGNVTDARFIIPLRGKESLLGFLAVGKKVRHREISLEDRELLEVLGNQTASALLNVSLFRKVAEVSEVEAFRNMSAFFLHDMKNLANQLSLTVENLPKYYDNQEFREDALNVLSESVDRIKRISSGMVLLKEELKVELVTSNINEFIEGILAEMRAEIGDNIFVDLEEVPPAAFDREQLRKVVVNLLLNAADAVRAGGGEAALTSGANSGKRGEVPAENSSADAPIRVRTRDDQGAAVIEISDDGCGMTPEFIRDRLFQAFQTTKQQGMGVGLFQSRMIVEAHRGRIEVESEPGRGSTFRIFLPPPA